MLLEAAAFHKPVAACKSQGPCEIIIDGETGFLTEQDDAASLAAAIDKLHHHRQLCNRLGKAGFERTQSMFSPITNTKKIEAIIEQSLAPPNAQLLADKP